MPAVFFNRLDIVVKSLDDLSNRAVRQQGDFIYVQPWMSDEQWRSVIRDPTHPDHNKYVQAVRSEIGPASLDTFDPDYDCFSHPNFNTGAFASRRFAIKESDLASLNEAERKFYREVLSIDEWNWKSSELFFRDQGRLNYLTHKLSISVFPIEPDLICRTGASATQVSFDDVEKTRLIFTSYTGWEPKARRLRISAAGRCLRCTQTCGRMSGKELVAT